MATATAKKPKKKVKAVKKAKPTKKSRVWVSVKPKTGMTTRGGKRKRDQVCSACGKKNSGHNARNCPN